MNARQWACPDVMDPIMPVVGLTLAILGEIKEDYGDRTAVIPHFVNGHPIIS
jgi:hypothetical protein